jgi:Domain of unknown function (DUF4505)
MKRSSRGGWRRGSKCYYYSVDLKGRVYLEETMPKNMATCLKDNTFLDMFFRNIRKIDHSDCRYLSTYGIEQDYPYVSPCGPLERNYIRPADTPIVFHSLQQVENNDVQQAKTTKDSAAVLCYGGTLTQLFLPTKLAISKRTGKLYHVLDSHAYLSAVMTEQLGAEHQQQCYYGLLSSSIAMALSDHLVDGTTNSIINTSSSPFKENDSFYSGIDYVCSSFNNTGHIYGTRYPISWLPDTAEPGQWSFSYYEETKNNGSSILS